jgi:hypothetical protein
MTDPLTFFINRLRTPLIHFSMFLFSFCFWQLIIREMGNTRYRFQLGFVPLSEEHGAALGRLQVV